MGSSSVLTGNVEFEVSGDVGGKASETIGLSSSWFWPSDTLPSTATVLSDLTASAELEPVSACNELFGISLLKSLKATAYD